MLQNMYNHVRYLFWEHACAGSFTVSLCDKIGVSVCAHNMCVQHMFVCLCVCVRRYVMALFAIKYNGCRFRMSQIKRLVYSC